MTYVLSDIHGNMANFKSILKQIDLQPEDTLYVLGDVVDRYPDGIRIIRMIMSMPNVKMILGNHEYMMLKALTMPHARPDSPWERNFPPKEIRLWYVNLDTKIKIDVYAQLRANWERFSEYVWRESQK